MDRRFKGISWLAAVGLLAAAAVFVIVPRSDRTAAPAVGATDSGVTAGRGRPDDRRTGSPAAGGGKGETSIAGVAPDAAAAEHPADTAPATDPAPGRVRDTEDLGALRSSLLEAVRRDPAAAFAILTALPLSDRLKIDIGGEMLGLWAAGDPRAAAAWAEQNRWPRELGGPVVKVADEWARRDPAAALDWAAGLAPGLDQVGAIIAATGRWSKTDFSAVADHVSRQPRGIPRDVMAGTLAREFGQEDPVAGLQWALIVEDPVGRERAAAGAIADVHAADPARAALLLQSAGLSPEFRRAVEKRVAGPLPWWH